ncbi:MAG: type III-B CRISPR module-associated protein Cmr5, partial [Chloroflexota bacterium]
MSKQRSLEQERAAAAWQKVTDVRDNGRDKYAKEYGQLARSAPANIQTNGLGQTMAFWRAKGYDKGHPKENGRNAHYQLLMHVSEWVRGQLKLGDTQDVLEWIIQEASSDEYRRATTEAIAFLTWL